MVTGGHNNGRVGTIVHKEKHRGGHDIVHIEDSSGNRCVLTVGVVCAGSCVAEAAARGSSSLQTYAFVEGKVFLGCR
jgi:hypothetical protein